MTQTIYRSANGRREIAAWCEHAYQRWHRPHRVTAVPTPAGETHTVAAGRHGRPVLLLPGTGLASATWLELVSLLADEHAVVGVDVPGQPGLSQGVAPTTSAAYGQWLAAVLAELDLAGAIVVGHAIGAHAALAAANHGRISGLVLVGPAGVMRLRMPMATLAATLPWLTRPRRASASRLLDRMVGPVGRVPPHLIDWTVLVGRHVRPTPPVAALPDAVLRGVDVPVTVVSGTQDTYLPPEALREASDRLANVRLEMVTGAGHLLPHERPDSVVTAVRQMTQRLDLP
jgi:pimeloyl-ACP methyl ester carboxylesterase